MARHAPNTQHVSQAEVEGAIAGYFGVLATEPGIRDLSRVVFPGVESASRQNPAGWRSVIPNVLANHVSMARNLGLAHSALQQQLDIMRHSNRTSADFAQALSRVQTLVAGMGGWGRVASAIESGGTGHTSSAARAMEMNGGPYTESNLSSDMRSYSSFGYSRGHMAGVGNYLHGLGMDTHQVHQYAGYFAGSSDTVRNAIRDHVQNQTQLTDEHVTNPNDARAIMGAINAGKIKLEDAPPSVRRLMEDMKARGVDPATADPHDIHRYLERNPRALEAARRANAADISNHTGMTRDQIAAADEARRREAVAVSPPSIGPANSPSSTSTAASTTNAVPPTPAAPRQVAGQLNLGG